MATWGIAGVEVRLNGQIITFQNDGACVSSRSCLSAVDLPTLLRRTYALPPDLRYMLPIHPVVTFVPTTTSSPSRQGGAPPPHPSILGPALNVRHDV